MLPEFLQSRPNFPLLFKLQIAATGGGGEGSNLDWGHSERVYSPTHFFFTVSALVSLTRAPTAFVGGEYPCRRNSAIVKRWHTPLPPPPLSLYFYSGLPPRSSGWCSWLPLLFTISSRLGLDNAASPKSPSDLYAIAEIWNQISWPNTLTTTPHGLPVQTIEPTLKKRNNIITSQKSTTKLRVNSDQERIF